MAQSPAETRYANSGGVHIAYQVVGSGPLDLIFVPGWVSHLEHHWEEPRLAYFLHRLAGFSRLIILDKRGTGMSDRVAPLPDLEQRMDDVRAVQDAVKSERAVVFGYSEGGSMCQLFAATYPARTAALITYGCWAKRLQSADYPWGPTLEQRQRFYDFVVDNWGGSVDIADLAPSVANDPEFCEWFARYLRRSASPGAALALAQMNTHIDLRPILPCIHVPTLIIQRTEDKDAPVEGARYLAAHIAGSRYVELPGADHLPWVFDADSVLDAIEEFLKGLQLIPAASGSLAGVLAFQLSKAGGPKDASFGDPRLLAEEIIARHGGEVLSMVEPAAGLACFSGLSRTVRCALELKARVEAHRAAVRCGIHLGELGAIQARRSPAIQIARRMSFGTHAGGILVSRAVKDLLAGSGILFRDPPASQRRSGAGIDCFLVDALCAAPRAARGGGARPRAIPAGELTRHQRSVLELVAQGMSNKEIARLKRLSEHTVHRHVANIFDRLGVGTRAAAVAKGLIVDAGYGPNGR